MRIFIAGIMQGSNQGQDMHGQDYRQAISDALRVRQPDAEIVDPLILHPDGVAYDEHRAKQVLFELAAAAGGSDIVIAYLPKASMGTALEMIRAYDNGKVILSITPMAENWVIRALSTKVFPSLDAFSEWVRQADLGELIHAAARH